MAVIIAGLHHFGLAITFAAFIGRSRWFKQALALTTQDTLRLLKKSHIFLSIGLSLSLITGLHRLFAGLDKGVAFYMKNGLFHAKLGLVFLIIALELVCICITWTWTRRYKKDAAFTVSAKDLKKLKIAHMIKIHAFAALPFLAAAVARGVGL